MKALFTVFQPDKSGKFISTFHNLITGGLEEHSADDEADTHKWLGEQIALLKLEQGGQRM